MPKLFFYALPIALSACSSILPDIEDPTKENLSNLTDIGQSGLYGSMGSAAETNFEALDRATMVTASNIPQADTVNYAGHLNIGQASTGIMGEMDLSLDFENALVSGNVTNFIDTDPAPVAGDLAFSKVEINRQADPDYESQLGISFEGTITWKGVLDTVSGKMNGEFYNDSQLIGGDFTVYESDNGNDWLGGNFSAHATN